MKRILIIFLLFSLFGCQRLNEELDKVSGDIDQLEEQTIATINEQTTSINQDISALHSVQAAFQGEISSLKKDVAELETTMQTLRNERSRLLGEIEKLEEDAASVREDISDASNNINNNINTLKDAINKQLNELRLQVSSVENQISSLQQQDSKLRAEIELLTNKDKAIQESITALQSYVDIEIKEFSDAVAATYMTIEHYNSVIEQLLSLKTNIATWHTEIHSALDNAIAEVSNSLDYIEERTAAMEQLVESVVNGVESLIYIPIHEDGKATLYFSNEQGVITNSYAVLDFAVYPTAAAAELATLWNKVLSVKAMYTTSTMETSTIPITSASAKDGVLTIMVDGSTLNESVYFEEAMVSLRLEVTNEANTITSKYVGLKRYDMGHITIPDEVFKGYLVENFDSNGDGEVSKSEAVTVQTIDVNGMNITSLAGIDYFVNLKSLNCSKTQVQHIDLSELPNLTSLDCSNTKVQYIDLSELPNLTSLDCSNSPIVNLNVSYLAKLCTFDCSNTQVQQLNLSELTNLTSLDCSNTKICQLNLNELINLTILDCHNTQIANLNVSDLSNLETLDCSNTQIQTLCCSGLSCLTTLNIGNCKLLTYLDCSNCALSSLDLSSNIALTHLNVCNNTEISILNIQYNTALEKLYAEGLSIGEITLVANTALAEVNVMNNAHLKTIIVNSTSIFSLKADNGVNVIDESGAAAVWRAPIGTYLPPLRGIVFYNDGKVVKLVSVAEAETKLAWSTEQINTYAKNADDGMANMETIKAINPDLSKYPAFKWCADYGLGWYLPSFTELQEIYNQRYTINEVLSACGYTTITVKDGEETEYWSSYELNSYSARTIYLNAGHYWGYPNKYSIYKVRAVYTIALNN